jgi:hypothetical protein
MQALKGNWLVECNIFTSIVTILYYDRWVFKNWSHVLDNEIRSR